MLTRYFTKDMDGPYSDLEWEYRDISINRPDGSTVFEQKGVHVPSAWSMNATTILAQKYFRGVLGSPERESSFQQVIHRVVQTIVDRGRADGYFVDDEQAKIFMDELSYVLAHQMASFNSPVWFNIGVEGVPQQSSACFILSVEDEMESILNWYREEGIIFKGGSGAGVNLSGIRSSHELLKGGGTASGPVSFMRGADSSAGTIKSGGKTRRAAAMRILNIDHPDIEEFIWCKSIEERKARALRDAGFDMSLDGKDGFSVQYQNANNSVRVTDEFMEAVLEDKPWELRSVKRGEGIRTMQARDLMRQIAQAAWECADPGLQFDTTINHWHTTPNAGRINGSNPCFTGDTLVATADGRNAVRIDELVGTETHVYAKDAAGNTVIRTMRKVRMTRADAPIVRVRLDDGTWVDCTPDHRFMLNNGSYVSASELKRGDSLKRFDSVAARYGHAAPVNHKVVSVEPTGYADVFDGEVDELHNFAVVTSVSGEICAATLSGVFVHNCSEYLSLDNSSCNLASLLRITGNSPDSITETP